MRESDEYYRDLETTLLELLAGQSELVGTDRVREVAEFIDHAEFGVALVWLADSLVETGASLSPSTRDQLNSLARVMGIVDEMPVQMRDLER